MQIIPAIDIQDSKVVRLNQGKFQENKVYSDSPAEIAKNWQAQGAKYLHVIDLDGARTGSLVNLEAIGKIISQSSLSVQVGGGIRDKDAIKSILDLGADRVILGTVVLEKKDLFCKLIEDFKDNIMVALDTKGAKLVSRGWEFNTDFDYISIVKSLEDLDVKTLILTDVSRDGMLTSPNFDLTEELLTSTNIPIIASGGIATIEHVKRLHDLQDRGLKGVIIGKALYEEKLSLKDAIGKFGD